MCGRSLKFQIPPCTRVLRRLQKEECLEVYDMAIDGRNRRYYKITEKGRVQLNLYRGGMGGIFRKNRKDFRGNLTY